MNTQATCVDNGLLSTVLGLTKNLNCEGPYLPMPVKAIAEAVIVDVLKGEGLIKNGKIIDHKAAVRYIAQYASSGNTAAHGLEQADEPRIPEPEGDVDIHQLARLVSRHSDRWVGDRTMYKWLRDHGYLIRRKVMDYNLPAKRWLKFGLFKIMEDIEQGARGSVVKKSVVVTSKGQKYFVGKFAKQVAA